MIIGNTAFCFLIYSFLILMGSPKIVVLLQLAALAIAGTVVLFRAVRHSTWIFPPAFLFALFLFLTYLSVSLMWGLENTSTPPAVIMRFLQNFLITLSLPLLGYSFSRLSMMPLDRTLRHVLRAAIVYAIIKMLIVIVVAVFQIKIIPLKIVFMKLFDTVPTFDYIAYGIVRFMSPADFILPFVLYYGLFFMQGKKRVFLTVLMSVSIFLSFSRFVWIEALFAIFSYIATLSPGKIFAVLVALIFLVPLIFITVPMPLIERRFSSSATQQSDATRLQQYDALTGDVEQNVLFGHGLASFAVNFVRNPEVPYTYELQWVSLLYQMGVVGVLFLLGLIFFNGIPFILSRSWDAVPPLLLYGVYILSGFANPSLVGRSSSAGLLFILCFGTKIYNRNIVVRSSLA